MKQGKQQKRVQPTSKKEEGLSYSVEVRDKEGRVLQRISAPSRSYVQPWNQILRVQTAQHQEAITDIDGVLRTCNRNKFNFSIETGTMGVDDRAIVVGKGTTAVAITDYALESRCLEGTGLDEFNYQAQTYIVPAVVGSTCSFTIKRIFINNSGAPITGIREIGVYIRIYNYYGLGFRDVLPGGVTVPDGGSITVTYTIAVTV